MRILCLLALSLFVLAGCRFGKLPNPNAHKTVDKYDGAALQDRVLTVNRMLAEREMRGQIDGLSKQRVLHDYIKQQIRGIDSGKIAKDQVWRFADVYRQLGDWQKTHDLYAIAVKNARDDDRRVNDSIRLAEAKAMLGDVESGVALVRSTFTANPGDKGPILLATLYEFVPASLGKGMDVEIALLVQDTIDQHFLTVVDPKTEPGRAFLQARRHHVEQAWRTVIQLLQRNGVETLLREALRRSDETMGRFARA